MIHASLTRRSSIYRDVVPALKDRPKIRSSLRDDSTTPRHTEIDYYLHGGILPYVLRQLLPGTTGF